ncbi:peptide deformylase [Streptomyces monashensis]|nr:peptide deformylase [Streptomyces monashensis]
MGHSAETDEQYEGCLSFFDVRGLVPRPMRITVEATTLADETTTTV